MATLWDAYHVAITTHSSLRSKAHRLVAVAIRRGELAPVAELYCVDCGRFAECYDHRDYAKPLAVDPVCRKCNVRRGRTARDYELSEMYRAAIPHYCDSGVRRRA